MSVELTEGEISLKNINLQSETYSITNMRVCYQNAVYPKLNHSIELERISNVQVEWGIVKVQKIREEMVLNVTKILMLFGYIVSTIAWAVYRHQDNLYFGKAMLLMLPVALAVGTVVLALMFVLQKVTTKRIPKAWIKFYLHNNRSSIKKFHCKKHLNELIEVQHLTNQLIQKMEDSNMQEMISEYTRNSDLNLITKNTVAQASY